MSKRKCLKLLNCHLLNKKFKLTRKRIAKDDLLLRFEERGSFLCEYYLNYKDTVHIINLNKGNLICIIKSKCMVYDLQGMIYCIIT